MTQRNKIAFFGTSHTYGDCAEGISHHKHQTKFVADPWPKLFAEKLNKEFYNFGIGGSDNMNILDAILEAFNRGVMDEVDTLILEPRLAFDTVKLPYDNIDYDIIEEDFTTKENREPTHWLDFGRHYQEHDWAMPAPQPEKLWARFALHDLENEERFKSKLRAKYVGDPKQKSFVDKDIKKFVELTKLYHSSTRYIDYKNFQFIKNVKTLCDGFGINFYWLNFEGLTRMRMGGKKDFIYFDNDKNLMDGCLNPDKSVRDYIYEFCQHNNKPYTDYLCSCNHFNQKAQPRMTEYLLQGYHERKNN